MFCFPIGWKIFVDKIILTKSKTKKNQSDFSQAKWPERRESLTQQGPLSAVSAAAALKASQLVEISRASTSTGPSYRSVGRVAIDNNRKTKSRIKTRYPPVYVKLAEENAPAEQSDSDSAAYDSFNDAETGNFPPHKKSFFNLEKKKMNEISWNCIVKECRN